MPIARRLFNAAALMLALSPALAPGEPVEVLNLTTFRGTSGDTAWPAATSPSVPPTLVDDRLHGITRQGLFTLPTFPAQYQNTAVFDQAFAGVIVGSGLDGSGALVRDPDSGRFYGAGVSMNVFALGPGLLYRTEFDGAYAEKIADLEDPNGVLLIQGRTLYGLDQGPAGDGRLFALDLDDAQPKMSTVHTFAAGPSGFRQYPNGLIAGSDGWLYGVSAYRRGVPYMAGTPSAPDTPTGALYRLDPQQPGSFEVLHTFTLAEGELPWRYCEEARCYLTQQDWLLAWLVEAPDGYFYGTTSVANCKTKGISEDPTHSNYLKDLPLCAGKLEADSGAAQYASAAPYYEGENLHGSLYRIRPDGSDFTVLHRFSGDDGSQPRGPLALGSDGRIYGVTMSGGQTGVPQSADYDPAAPGTPARSYSGTLYRLDPQAITLDAGGAVVDAGFETVHSFASAVDGSMPVGLIAGDNGQLYGATMSGGESYINTAGKVRIGQGTVFQVNLDPSSPRARVTVTVSPGEIEGGDSATLIWTTVNASHCIASGGHEGDGWAGPQAGAGDLQVSPPRGVYYYTLTCEDDLTGGQVGGVASLGVGAPDRDNDGNSVHYGNGSGGGVGPLLLGLLALLLWRRRSAV